MALQSPIEAFMQMQQMRNQNQRNSYQDMAGIGQGLGQGMEAIGNAITEHKKQQVEKAKHDIVLKLIQQMQTQGAPQQGPPLPPGGMSAPSGGGLPQSMGMIPPGQPMTAGTNNVGQDVQMQRPPQAPPMPQAPPGPPSSGIGGPAQDNTQQIQSLLMQYDPEGTIKQMMAARNPPNPLQLSEIAKNYAEAKKAGQPKADSYRPYGDSPAGTGLILDSSSGKVTDTGVKVKGKKDAEMDWKETKRQDYLEGKYTATLLKLLNARTGGLGQQDAKVNQAVHLRTIANQYYDPQKKSFEIPEMQTGEMLVGLANLVSGQNVASVEVLRSVTPKTAAADMHHMVAYWTGKPVTSSTQAMYKNLIDSIDRQGKTSEKLRDHYMEGAVKTRPLGLDRDNAERLAKIHMATSYTDFLEASPDQGGNAAGGSSGVTDEEKAFAAAYEKKHGITK